MYFILDSSKADTNGGAGILHFFLMAKACVTPQGVKYFSVTI